MSPEDPPLPVEDLLSSMRDGNVQSEAAIRNFVDGVVSEAISRPQAAAWLAWAFARGLSSDETVFLTRAMTHSGEVLRWEPGSKLIDKHSTGGVGDKVSLVLAPLWAELGYRVPMISGRGLGHTGGTLDKLESIDGYRCDIEVPQLSRQLGEVGCFISGQTAALAPADRVLYALRNETATVPSIPLIVASILSKKLAEGVEHLVLDVKTGSGAFMQELPAARRLAETLVEVARGAGLSAEARITAMDRPLGCAVGNGLEVIEAIACLQGEGPADLRTLTTTLAADPRAAEVLASGAALERFRQMVSAQGGDARLIDEPGRLIAGTKELTITAQRAGWLTGLDALGLGRAAFCLGAGRRRAEQAVDPGVGLYLLRQIGDAIAVGEPLLTVHHRDGWGLDEAREFIAQAIRIGPEPIEPRPLVLGAVS